MKITNALVIEKARELGFGLIGFAKAEPLKEEISRLDEWLSRKYNAGMAYMENNREKRLDIRNILPEAESVISLTYNYNTGIKPENDTGSGKISRYAFGKDYHLILWEKLDLLIKSLKEADSSFIARSYVDTGPLMDKAWAVRSGIGWMGKHSNVITREEGSWVFLSTVITNIEFEYGSQLKDYCGSCTRCIDACPTDAIIDSRVIDAGKCISYLTIENKSDEIDNSFAGQFEGWLFGCDICQEVCPWNTKFEKLTKEEGFFPRSGTAFRFQAIEEMENKIFKEQFAESPVLRARLKGLKRNARFLKENKQKG